MGILILLFFPVISDIDYIDYSVSWGRLPVAQDKPLRSDIFPTNCPIEKQCVEYVKGKGIELSGNAWELKPNSQIPKTGSAILFENHVGYVEKIAEEKLLISEKNLYKCDEITWRWIEKKDPRIRGFLY